MRSEDEIAGLVAEYVTDDPVFGFVCPLPLQAFFDEQKLGVLQEEVNAVTEGTILVVGVGATLMVPEPNILIYADMPRWEIQLRFRQKRISNLLPLQTRFLRRLAGVGSTQETGYEPLGFRTRYDPRK